MNYSDWMSKVRTEYGPQGVAKWSKLVSMGLGWSGAYAQLSNFADQVVGDVGEDGAFTPAPVAFRPRRGLGGGGGIQAAQNAALQERVDQLEGLLTNLQTANQNAMQNNAMLGRLAAIEAALKARAQNNQLRFPTPPPGAPVPNGAWGGIQSPKMRPLALSGRLAVVVGANSYASGTLNFASDDVEVWMDTGGVVAEVTGVVVDGVPVPLGPGAGGTLPGEILDASTFHAMPLYVGPMEKTIVVNFTGTGVGFCHIYARGNPYLSAQYKSLGACGPCSGQGAGQGGHADLAADVAFLKSIIGGGGGSNILTQLGMG